MPKWKSAFCFIKWQTNVRFCTWLYVLNAWKNCKKRRTCRLKYWFSGFKWRLTRYQKILEFLLRCKHVVLNVLWTHVNSSTVTTPLTSLTSDVPCQNGWVTSLCCPTKWVLFLFDQYLVIQSDPDSQIEGTYKIRNF